MTIRSTMPAHGLKWKRGDDVIVTSIDHHSDLLYHRETALGKKLRSRIIGIPGVSVYSPDTMPVISFNVDGLTPNECATRLDDMQGICVRSGMHYAQSFASSFHPEGTVRASIGCCTTEQEVTTFCETVKPLTSQMT